MSVRPAGNGAFAVQRLVAGLYSVFRPVVCWVAVPPPIANSNPPVPATSASPPRAAGSDAFAVQARWSG